jgi:excisionase family DNA binding protein
MSTMESKLEAWLRYVAKQEEAIKHPDEVTSEPQQMAAPAAAPVVPAAPVAASPASTPTLASTPTVTATIERQLRHTAPPEPAIPEVEDFLPILRRRTEPPAFEQPQTPAPPQSTVEQKPEPIQMSAPPPAPVAPAAPRVAMPPSQPAPAPVSAPAPTAPRAVMPPSPPKPVEPTFVAPQAPAPPQPVQTEQPAPAPQAAAAKPRIKTVAPPAPMQVEGAQEMWDRLPRHVQLLVGTHPKEIAQPSYKKFKETREELVERLLDPTLSLEEAARILNVCPTTVRRYTNKNQLRHLRTAGNQRRFRLSDILAFMEAQASKKTE